MNERSDQQLLRDFVQSRSDSAFAEIVRRHVDAVYSAALRMLREPHLAHDVTQDTFIALAQRVHQLTDRAVLSGWLHTVAHNLAANVIRAEVRRRNREQQAAAMNDLTQNNERQDHSAPGAALWEQISPELDAALHELSDADRDALTLRFFERKSAREMAQILNLTDEAAQKRVSRAIERLRELLVKRGLTANAAALVLALSTQSVQAAPVGLATALATTTNLSIATTAAAATKTIAMTILQKTAVTAVIALSLGTGVYQFNRAAVARRELESTRHGNAPVAQQLQHFQDENARATTLVKNLQSQNQQLEQQIAELHRLRGEVSGLREDARELARLKATGVQSQPLEGTLKLLGARVSQLRNSLEQMPEKKIPELQLLKDTDWLDAVKGDRDLSSDEGVRRTLGSLRYAAKRKVGNLMRDALKKYTAANNNQLPPNFEALKPFFQEPIDDSILQRYALTESGSLADVPDDGKDARKSILVAEQAAPADPEHDLNFQFAIGGILTQRAGDAEVVDYLGYGDEAETAPGMELEIEIKQPSPAAPKK